MSVEPDRSTKQEQGKERCVREGNSHKDFSDAGSSNIGSDLKRRANEARNGS
jgi:hypothetical protein